MVADVRNTGQALLRNDSIIASFLSRPRLTPASAAVTIWMESATAMVMMMSGTPALTGLNTVPIQPAKPIVVLTVNITTRMVTRVPIVERSSTAVATRMIKNTIGVSFSISSLVASAKARFRTTSPVR